MTEPLMTVEDLAAKLQIAPTTIRAMAKAGKIPHTKIGRLYRFTNEHYETITATHEPSAPARTRRQNIKNLLRAV